MWFCASPQHFLVDAWIHFSLSTDPVNLSYNVIYFYLKITLAPKLLTIFIATVCEPKSTILF